jgi:DNA-binding IclR family transcriptional regulator
MGKSLGKAVGLLQAIADRPRTLSELAASAGLPPSTAHRLLTDLTEHGLVRQQGRVYRLGARLMSLGEQARRQFDLPELALPHMRSLSEATQETVHLGILDGNDVIYVAKVEGSRGLQMASYVGLRSPAQTTAIGKALIADLPSDEWSSRVTDLPPKAPHTITSTDAYLDEFADVARQGFALDREENELGVRCVAAPVREASGRAVAAISLSGAAAYISEARQLELVPAVQACAEAVSQRLGAHPDRSAASAAESA